MRAWVSLVDRCIGRPYGAISNFMSTLASLPVGESWDLEPVGIGQRRSWQVVRIGPRRLVTRHTRQAF